MFDFFINYMIFCAKDLSKLFLGTLALFLFAFFGFQNDIQILKEKLEKYLNSLDSDGFLVSSIALINACKISSEAILRAKELLSENSLELFAFELNLAIGELAKFTKDFDRNEILDEMFGNFCLGK